MGVEEEKICPRCGLKFSFITRMKRGARHYLYVVHREGGGRKRYCYLGPEGKYDHAEALLNLNLKNILDLDPVDVMKTALNLVREKAIRLRAEDRIHELKTLYLDLKELLERIGEVVASG